jgi:hypothetical protein
MYNQIFFLTHNDWSFKDAIPSLDSPIDEFVHAHIV